MTIYSSASTAGAPLGGNPCVKPSGDVAAACGCTGEHEEGSPKDWFRANGFKPCRTHNWRRPVEGCDYCARFHDERVEEVVIGGKRLRRYTPVSDADFVVGVAAKEEYRSSTRYGANSVNSQMAGGISLSAEDEFLVSIEVDEESVFNLVQSIDAELGVFLELYAERATTREIARQLSVSQSTAARKLKKAKQDLRAAANCDEGRHKPGASSTLVE